jgi:hypothetical protein
MLLILFLTRTRVKEDVMGAIRVGSIYGGEVKGTGNFGEKTKGGKKTLGGSRRSGVDGRILSGSSRHVIGWRDWIS